MVLGAAAGGVPLSRLYSQVVRPGLVAEGTGTRERPLGPFERLTLGSVRATLAVLAATPADGDRNGQGRRALVSVGQRALEAMDGQVIGDVLTADGWEVQEIEVGTPAASVARLARDLRVELVVLPTSRAADLLVAASTYTQLRRLPDPPLIVACSLGERDDSRRARAAGADAFVTDLDDLLSFVIRWLPARGARHWGVRLRRLADTLVVAPTGKLDQASVARLRLVVESRAGRFDGFVVDGRDVAGVTRGGLDALVSWLDEPPSLQERAPRLVAGGELIDALAAWEPDGAGAMLLDPREIAEAL